MRAAMTSATIAAATNTRSRPAQRFTSGVTSQFACQQPAQHQDSAITVRRTCEYITSLWVAPRIRSAPELQTPNLSSE
jgi:hypothetical protein